MCTEHANKNGFSFILENTWRASDMVITMAEEAHALGRKTHAVLVAVPAVVSQAGIAARFYEGIINRAEARWVRPGYFDDTVNHMVENVNKVLSASVMDEVLITDRQGTILYEGVPSPRAVEIFAENFNRTTLTELERSWVEHGLAVSVEGHEICTSRPVYKNAEQIEEAKLLIGRIQRSLKPKKQVELTTSINESVAAKIAARKTKGTPPPDRDKKHPSR